jgi:hypothetical protein
MGWSACGAALDNARGNGHDRLKWADRPDSSRVELERSKYVVLPH